MVKLTINGRAFEAEPCQTVLSVAQQGGIDIPTLCHSEAIHDYGACRVCLVEVERRGRKRLVTSCLYPVEEGLKVTTNSERVERVRKTVMELLLARCPQSVAVKEMAGRLGVTESRFKSDEEDSKDNCVLCGMCARVCTEVVGASAISLVNRGTEREVALPFYDDAGSCIACGSCAYICPTDAITIVDTASKRIISWPKGTVDFALKACGHCGIHFAPVKQLEFMAAKSQLSPTEFELCPDCRRLN